MTAVVRSDLLPATDSAAADHARNLDWVVGIETVVAHEVDLLIAALVAADNSSFVFTSSELSA